MAIGGRLFSHKRRTAEQPTVEDRSVNNTKTQSYHFVDFSLHLPHDIMVTNDVSCLLFIAVMFNLYHKHVVQQNDNRTATISYCNDFFYYLFLIFYNSDIGFDFCLEYFALPSQSRPCNTAHTGKEIYGAPYAYSPIQAARH